MTCQHCTEEATVEVYLGASVCKKHAEVLKSHGWKPITKGESNMIPESLGKRIVQVADNVLENVKGIQEALAQVQVILTDERK